MKTVFKQALLTSVILLMLIGISHAQLIVTPTPYDTADLQVPVDILMGLVDKYMVMIQEYQELNAQGGTPDSSMEFRLAANITVDDSTDSELGSLLSGFSNIAIWLKVNLFAMYPNLKVNLSGSLGDMELSSTTTESIILSRDEGIYAPAPLGTETSTIGDFAGLILTGGENLLPEVLAEIDAAALLTPDGIQQQLSLILAIYLASINMEYHGLEQTPKGVAHVVRLTSMETGGITKLWVLDETWDLYKVEIENPHYGITATVIIEGIEFATANNPGSVFEIDTTGLNMLSYDEFILSLTLKIFSEGIIGAPVAGDLSASLPVVSQGEQVIIKSNGLDSEDAESDLTVNIEYRPSDGVWIPLTGASYVGVSPSGHWEVPFVPSLSELPGSYDLKVTYTDTLGNVSDPLELSDAFTVAAIPPKVLSVSPIARGINVPVSSSLMIKFSQSMDMSSTEAAFSLTDPSGQVVSGSFEWTDSILIFKPAADLLYDTLYSAKILGSATGLNTAVMGSDFLWSFTTGSAPLPRVAVVSPANKQLGAAVSTQVSITFSEEMDQTSVESAFSLKSSDGQLVLGTFQWADKTVTFVPAQNLYYNTTYRGLIRGSAKSAAGVGLNSDKDKIAEGTPEDDFSWWFATEKFPVFTVSPIRKSVRAGDRFTINIVAQAMKDLKSFSLSINFDPTLLKIMKVERLSFAAWRPRPRFVQDVDMWQPTVIDNDQGLVIIAADSTRSGGVSGTGAIATLTFQALGVGESAISPQDVVAANSQGASLSPGTRDGSVQVLGINPWDINGDGVVDIRDFIIIQSGRGANADVNGDGVVDILDMVAASGGVQTSPALEPLTNTLANNFPNPFNPETWIPYELSGASHAVIRIYSVTGQLVRELDLGYRLPGRYITKATAAHWDGTNEVGERVASGIYYYSIKAGNFSAVKKMVVAE